MSRILVIVVLALWLLRMPETRGLEAAGPLSPAVGTLIFLGGYVVVIAGARFWANWVVRTSRRGRGVRRFQRCVPLLRNFLVLWMGVAIFGGLKWGFFVDRYLGPTPDIHVTAFALPRVLAGTLPALLAWMGLWWAQYPVDRALREQNLLAQLDLNLPVHHPPSFRQIFLANLRLQLLFTLVPVLGIMAAHDLVVAGLLLTGHGQSGKLAEDVMLPIAALMFVLAPEVLRRLADSEPLPAGALRTRLETLSRSAGLKYREILLWNTNNSMSNAFVMGLFGRVRYVLLSDELLATLRPEEVEAVFAHEMGHVVHHHLFWLAVVVMSVAGLLTGPLELLAGCIHVGPTNHWAAGVIEVAQYGLGIVLTFGMLSWLSQRFERQADVFAARLLQQEHEQRPPAPSRRALLHSSWVGEYGARVFNSALGRVAEVNNIPVHARDLLHPSISKRIAYLKAMSASPRETVLFDRFMRRTLALVLAALVVFGAWSVIQAIRG